MSEQLPFRIRRSAVEGKRPQNADLELGELALNTYDGRLFAKKDTGGVGVGTTVTLLTPWTENIGGGLYYNEGNVGLGTTNPTTKLWVSGDINFTGNLYQNGTIFQSGGGGTSSQWVTYGAGISTTSNVGIGTTNPTTKLQVNGSVTLGAGSTDLISIPGRIASNFYPDGDGTYDIGRPTEIGSGANRWRDANFYGKGSFDGGVDAHNIELGIGSPNLIYSTSGNLELNSQSGTTNIDDILTISGNTGIGTANPTTKLHVVGDGRFTGVITASSFVGNLTGTATTLSDAGNITTGTISSSRLNGSYGINITGTATTATNLSDAANITTGTISSSRLNGSYGISITGIANTLADAANITTGTISSSRLLGTYGISITGTANTLADAANITTGTISSSRLLGTYGISITGTANTLADAANITTGTISSSRLNGSYGISITGTANTATNLSDAANITTGTISSSRLLGSYGISITGTANTATNLSDAANITTGTISSSRLSGTYGISITGTATTALGFSTTANINTSGIITATSFVGSHTGNLTGTATTATNLSDAANISTGTIDKDRISTTNALTVLGDLYVSNNISFGGTTTQLNIQQLEIVDPDIILGIGTSFSPTDNTANHGGIAIASTEGFPLVNLNIVPGETNPTTYKKIMWFKGDTIGAGLTDAWLFNYAVGIGSTQVPNGVRLAVGQIKMTDSAITATTFTGNLTGTATTANNVSSTININTSGIVTATGGFIGSLTGTATTSTNLSNAANITTGTISSSRLTGSYGIDITGTATTSTNLSNAANITTGTISSSRLSGTYDISITGTANTLADAANITTGTISSSRLSGTYGIDVTGTAGNLEDAANIITGTISSSRLEGSYGISITGTATTATTALGFSTTANINTSGIITATKYYGDGSSLSGITASGSGIVVRSNGSPVGTAGTIDFTSNLSVSFDAGITTVSATGGSSSQWVTYEAGISTTSNVGIGTTNPQKSLHVYTADGDIKIGDITEGTGSTDAGIIFTGLGSNTSAAFTELDGTILSYGINCAQITGIETARIGGLFRFDTRTSGPFGDANCFVVKGRSGGSTTEYNALVVGLNDGTTSLSPFQGNVGVGTTNPTSKLTVVGDASISGLTTTNNLYVAGVGTFLSSGLKIRNPANTFQYNITAGAITTADRALNLPVITADDTVAVLGLSQTFTQTQTFSGTLTGSGTVNLTGTAAGVAHNFGTSQTTSTLAFGGTSGTGTITLGQATTSQTTNIQAGVTASGNTKTINFGTLGASGSFTQINIGPTAGVGTIAVQTGTNLLVGTTTATGTASQRLQVNSGAYVSGNLGIGTTNPTSTLTVVGNGLFSGTGIVTATTFVGSLTGTASTATTALGFSTTANINTSGIITATTFVGGLTGTATTATTALGFSTTASINTTGIVTASQLVSNVAQGTAPITVGSSTIVTNLNTNYLNGQLGSYYTDATNLTGTISSSRLTGSYGIDITGTATTATTALGFSTTANINTSGIITATKFSGDGSLLTNITASGSGIVVRSNGSPVGTAGTIDFTSNLSVSFDAGITTVSATGGGSGGASSQWVTYAAGISTTSNVGIGSTAPTAPLDVVGNAKFTGIVTTTELDLTGNATIDDSVLYLSGAPLGTSTKNGLLGIGQLSFSDTDIVANFVHDVNGYAQVVLQNKNSGASASSDFIVNNDRTAGTTYYGDFGINGTTFSGGGPFGDVDGTYLYSAGGTLALGSLDDYDVKIATNNTERVRINATGVGIGTINPTSALHVQGSAYVSGISTLTQISAGGTVGTAGSVLSSTGAGLSWIAASGSSGGISISTNTTNQSQYLTYATETGSTTGLGVSTTGLTFNPSSGNLGIGTASPAFTADIAGDARVTSTNKMRFGGTAGTTNFYIQYNSTANSLDFVAG